VGLLFDLLVIVTLVSWIVGLTAQGLLAPQAAGAALLGLVVLMAIARTAKIGMVRLVFRLALPLGSLATLLVWYGRGDVRATTALLGAVGGLVVVLFGIYVIFRGALPRKS